MRNYFYILLLGFILPIQNFAQEYETIIKTKKLIENRDIYLNGGFRSQLGGKSRTYIKFDLPKNTIKWYYSFTTSKGQNGSSNLNLALQLTSLLSDPSGITSGTLSSVKIPDGVALVDIYLLDKKNLSSFASKADLNGGSYNYYEEGTLENTKQALVEIDDVKRGTWYLGIKNPSSINGVNISIEVVAITETKKEIEKTEAQKNAELYGELARISYINGNYIKAIELCNTSIKKFELGWVFVNKGLSELLLKQDEKAITTFIKAITLIKKQPKANFHFKQTIKDLEKALTECPESKSIKEILELIRIQL